MKVTETELVVRHNLICLDLEGGRERGEEEEGRRGGRGENGGTE